LRFEYDSNTRQFCRDELLALTQKTTKTLTFDSASVCDAVLLEFQLQMRLAIGDTEPQTLDNASARPSSRYAMVENMDTAAPGSSKGPRKVGVFEPLMSALQAPAQAGVMRQVEVPINCSGGLVRLVGPHECVVEYLEACRRAKLLFFEAEPSQRQAESTIPYPIFVFSRGRCQTAMLNLTAGHALGQREQGKSNPVFIIVLDPKDIDDYRNWHPNLLFLALSETGRKVGYARNVIKRMCTDGVCDAAGLFINQQVSVKLPFYWSLDDNIVCFQQHKLNPFSSTKQTVDHHPSVPLLLHALLSVQRMPEFFCYAMIGEHAVSIVEFINCLLFFHIVPRLPAGQGDG
jgi:hypothetical protein